MLTYTVRRVTAKGETYEQKYPTFRKAYNAVGRLQENSSRSSMIYLLENDRVIDTFTGLN